MSNEIAERFLLYQQESDALELLKNTRCSGLHNLAVFLGKFFEKQFPYSVDIKHEYALSNYFLNNYENAFDIFQTLLNFKNISEEIAKVALFNAHFSIDHIENKYIHYNPDKVHAIARRPLKVFPLVTVTVTTCKRLDLFTQTMNSFINCCEDIDMVDEWICVDDNSSTEDREKMQKLYPFFKFYMKDQSSKGHPQSMNIIKSMVKTPFVFHMEDDWKFFDKRRYVSECLDVLADNPKIGQCLLNKNYAETEGDIAILGGEFHQTKTGLRYYIHEYVATEEQKKIWHKKHGNKGIHCNYWPHFSFRPSLLRTKILHELGEFDTKISHFEMEYSTRYVTKGYISAFLEGISCLHTGRLTSQLDDPTKLNAYILNDEAQFCGKEENVNKADKLTKQTSSVSLSDFDIKIKTYVVNLDRRPDRWETFQEKATPLLSFLNYERFSAVDGSKLRSNAQLQRIFDNNDYNMRKGMVGCAMSHIKLYTELVNSDEYDAFLIFEDDLDFVPQFDKKFLHAYKQLRTFSWDMMYLGNHLRVPSEIAYDKEVLPLIEKWDANTSLTKSLGGTGGYLISKQGAKKLLDFINETGMTNGIDTVQQKSANNINIFYCHPHLFYSECFTRNNNVDTNIQHDYDSLTLSLEARIENEIKYYNNKVTRLNKFENALEFVLNQQSKKAYFQGTSEEVEQLHEKCIHPCYMFEKTVIFVVPGGDKGRYFHRMKKDDKYDVEDALHF